MNIIEKNKKKIGIILMLCIIVAVIKIAAIIFVIPISYIVGVFSGIIALFLLGEFLEWCFRSES